MLKWRTVRIVDTRLTRTTEVVRTLRHRSDVRGAMAIVKLDETFWRL